MFDFSQLPSKTGTIAVIDAGGVIMQVAFHAGAGNYGESFLRISSCIITGEGADLTERFNIHYLMHGTAVPYTDDVVLIDGKAVKPLEVRHAA